MTTTFSSFRNLITKSMNTKQISKIVCVIMLVFSMIACKKETPVTVDNIKPKMQLQITGYAVNKTFYSDSTDYYSTGSLYLKPDLSYDFTLTITDTGGVNWLQMQSDTNVFNIQNFASIPTPATYTIVSDISTYKILGDRANPYKSYIMTGNIKVRSNAQSTDPYVLQCIGNDYTPNIVGLNIPFIITNQPPNGYGWKEL